MSRRSLLAGGVAIVVLAACGGDDSSAGGDDAGVALGRFFPDPIHTAGTNRRIALGLLNADGSIRIDGPPVMSGVLLDGNGTELGLIEGVRREAAIPRAYYEFRLDFPTPGTYTMRVEVDGTEIETSLTAAEAGALSFPGPGDPMPPFDTPTSGDGRGVDPICTREPFCPFHEVTLSDALAAGERIAYLIGTPAYCETAICGPVLDVMMGLAGDYPQVRFLHSEVYTDDTITTPAPAVAAAGLSFEPVIFLIVCVAASNASQGVIVDEDELRSHLDALG